VGAGVGNLALQVAFDAWPVAFDCDLREALVPARQEVVFDPPVGETAFPPDRAGRRGRRRSEFEEGPPVAATEPAPVESAERHDPVEFPARRFANQSHAEAGPVQRAAVERGHGGRQAPFDGDVADPDRRRVLVADLRFAVGVGEGEGDPGGLFDRILGLPVPADRRFGVDRDRFDRRLYPFVVPGLPAQDEEGDDGQSQEGRRQRISESQRAPCRPLVDELPQSGEAGYQEDEYQCSTDDHCAFIGTGT
jgi:hypothetical protein